MTSAPIFEYPVLIREIHLDTFGHVNNAAYLQILEEARWELITSRGFGLREVQKTGQGPTILEIQMRFRKELRNRQRIVVRTQLLSYEGKIMKLKQWMENEAAETCFEAEFIMGLFDVRERKLVLPTPAWLKAVGLTD